MTVKWGASSRWSSSNIYCPIRNSDKMTIGKTHPTLLTSTFGVFSSEKLIVLIEIIVTRWQKWRFQDWLNTVILNDEIMALNKIILVRFDLDFCNSTFSNRIDFPIWTWSLRKVHYHVHLIRFYSQRQLSKLILLIYKIIHTIGSFTTNLLPQ